MVRGGQRDRLGARVPFTSVIGRSMVSSLTFSVALTVIFSFSLIVVTFESASAAKKSVSSETSLSTEPLNVPPEMVPLLVTSASNVPPEIVP